MIYNSTVILHSIVLSKTLFYTSMPISFPISFKHWRASVRASNSSTAPSASPFDGFVPCEATQAAGVLRGDAAISQRIGYNWKRWAFAERLTASAISLAGLREGSGPDEAFSIRKIKRRGKAGTWLFDGIVGRGVRQSCP